MINVTSNIYSHLYYLLNLKNKVKTQFGNVGDDPVIWGTTEDKLIVSHIPWPTQF